MAAREFDTGDLVRHKPGYAGFFFAVITGYDHQDAAKPYIIKVTATGQIIRAAADELEYAEDWR